MALRFDELFDPAFLAGTQRFSLRIARGAKGGRIAEQATTARGQGTDFADFKPYVAGDDLRSVDWNIYRRLGRAFVRVFEERQDLPVYLLVDLSGSMFVETPPRAQAALRTALALAATALNQQDSVRLFPFAGDLIDTGRAVSGKSGIARIAHILADQAAAAERRATGLVAAANRLAAMGLRRGLVMIVSDFLDEAGAAAVVAALDRVPHRLLLAQVVRDYDADPALHPDLAGEVLMEDGEREAGVAMTMTPALLDRYRTAYRAFDDAFTGFAARRGAGLVRIDAARPVLEQLDALFGAGELVL